MKQTIKVPNEALAVPGENENEMVSPKAGDRVQVMVEARVSSEMDGQSVIEIDTANGVTLEDEPGMMSDDEEEEALRRELEEETAAEY